MSGCRFVEVFPRLRHELAEMNILAVWPERHQNRKCLGGVRPEDVGAKHGAVPRRDADVLVQNHCVTARVQSSYRTSPSSRGPSTDWDSIRIAALQTLRRSRHRPACLFILIKLIFEPAHVQVKPDA